MKTIIKILLLSLIFTGCTPDEIIVKEPECDCYKQTLVKSSNSNIFVWNGAEEYYSNDCTDDGDDLGGTTNESYEIRYKVKCR